MTDTVTLEEGRYGGVVRRTVLPHGLRVVTEAVPGVRSASFGIYAGVGSRDESVEVAGASHFLEHLLFKGTRRRNAMEISSAIEEVGGDTNAYTTKEHTCYYARVLDRDLPLAIDVICDMITSSVLDATEIEIERGVILEEIAMHEDEPSDAVHDLFADAVYPGHPLGRPVLGSVESIRGMSRERINDFYRAHYGPADLVVAAAGNLEHERVVELVAAAFDTPDIAQASTVESPIDHEARRVAPSVEVPFAAGVTAVRRKDTEQAHLVLGTPGLHRHDERRFALAVVNQILGGGMSSRLFQEIRERRGLAYSVYSFASQFADAGNFAVYAGCAPNKAREVADLVRAELTDVAANGITDAEIVRGKGMISGATVLSLEDTGSRMGRIGKSELCYASYLSIDEQLERVESVTAEQVRSVAAEVLDGPLSTSVVGPFDKADLTG